MKPLKATLPAITLSLIFGNAAWASDETTDRREKILLAGEILIGPDKTDNRASGARSQRERAGAYQRGGDIPAPVEEDGGFLSPRGGAPADERAYDNRARARAYQQGGDMPAAIQGMPSGMGDFPPTVTTQDRARDLRTRARTYTGSGNAQDLDLSNVGSDGIPIVPCRGDVDNVAARIGEDSMSGSVFYIMRQGRQVKVRCK